MAILFHYLTGSEYLGVLPRWLALALAPATAISARQFFGVSHPPAGAGSLLFIPAPPPTTRPPHAPHPAALPPTAPAPCPPPVGLANAAWGSGRAAPALPHRARRKGTVRPAQ